MTLLFLLMHRTWPKNDLLSKLLSVNTPNVTEEDMLSKLLFLWIRRRMWLKRNDLDNVIQIVLKVFHNHVLWVTEKRCPSWKRHHTATVQNECEYRTREFWPKGATAKWDTNCVSSVLVTSRWTKFVFRGVETPFTEDLSTILNVSTCAYVSITSLRLSAVRIHTLIGVGFTSQPSPPLPKWKNLP